MGTKRMSPWRMLTPPAQRAADVDEADAVDAVEGAVE
jgi:hypothetical protein